MTEIHHYVCDYCGKIFDDKDDCHAHEIEERMGNLVDEIALYDELYQPIAFKDLISHKVRFDDIYYVSIQNKEAGEALNDFIENELGYSFYGETGMPTSYPCVLGYWQGDCWQNLTEMRDRIEAVFNHVE